MSRHPRSGRATVYEHRERRWQWWISLGVEEDGRGAYARIRPLVYDYKSKSAAVRACRRTAERLGLDLTIRDH